jgi:hypothetical protein
MTTRALHTLTLGLLLTTWHVASAATLDVPSATYATIQAAIDAAADGDTVRVDVGIYYGSINFKGKSITVTSTNPTNSAIVNGTVLDGESAGPVAIFNQAEGSGAILEGFTLQRGSASNSGAIYCSGSSPTILYNQIKQSSASANGGGLYCKDGSPTISHNKFSQCSAGAMGGGLYCESGSPTISDNEFANCTARDSGGGVAFKSCTGGRLTEALISDCSATNTGGGIYLMESTPQVDHCLLHGNTGLTGGGIGVLAGSPVIESSTLHDNTGTNGGGIAAYGRASVTITNCIITSSTSGNGIFASPISRATVAYCDVWDNEPANYSGVTAAATCISSDPLYVGTSDYHLQSKTAHWTSTGWVKDTAHSPCIDKGAPSSPWASEPYPNGGRINMGRYGNTAQASKSFYTPIGSKQADMWIALPTGITWYGNNVYNTTGVDQTLTQQKDPGQKAVFRLSAENDGASSAYLKVSGTGGNTAFNVCYYDALVGGRDITADVTASGWITPLLRKGAKRDLRVEVTLTSAAVGNTRRALSIRACDLMAPTVGDVVKAVAVCNVIRKPDGLIRRQGGAAWTGDGIYNTSGISQGCSNTVAAATPAVYELKVQNDGSVAIRVRVTATPSGSGWSIRYFDALTDGTDITSRVIGVGWLSAAIAPGAQRELRVEVTPDSLVAAGAAKLVTVAFADTGSMAKDVVKATTTKAP